MLDDSQRTVLERLPVAPQASFDSHADEDYRKCLPNNRVELLDQIMAWAGDPDAEAIFWLKGMAGTGKSTISRSIAEALDQAGTLGASFFFKRGEEHRDNPSKLFTTIASQLAARRPAVAPHIRSALDKDPHLSQKMLREQFERLVRQPLLAGLPPGHSERIVLVVDALDECDKEDRTKLVLHTFRNYEHLGLKIFITSRPEEPIRLGFVSIRDKYRDLILQEISQALIKRDLGIFFRSELESIRRDWSSFAPEEERLAEAWPEVSQVQCLVDMANPLFIFAATVCRFLADFRCGNPDQQLQEVLRYRGLVGQEVELDKTHIGLY